MSDKTFRHEFIDVKCTYMSSLRVSTRDAGAVYVYRIMIAEKHQLANILAPLCNSVQTYADSCP